LEAPGAPFGCLAAQTKLTATPTIAAADHAQALAGVTGYGLAMLRLLPLVTGAGWATRSEFHRAASPQETPGL